MTYGHLQADCLYTGISFGPNARFEYGKPLPLPFTFFTFRWVAWEPLKHYQCISRKVLCCIDHLPELGTLSDATFVFRFCVYCCASKYDSWNTSLVDWIFIKAGEHARLRKRNSRLDFRRGSRNDFAFYFDFSPSTRDPKLIFPLSLPSVFSYTTSFTLYASPVSFLLSFSFHLPSPSYPEFPRSQLHSVAL